MHLSLSHCENLVKEDIIKSLVSMLLPQELNYLGADFDILFHGNRIPPWFRFRSKKDSIKLYYPKGRCHNKFRGYEACVVLTSSHYQFDVNVRYPSLRIYVNNAGDSDSSIGERLQERYGYMMADEIMVERTRNVGSNLIWLSYSKCNPLWMPRKFDFTVFNYVVKECGVRLIWDEDIQEEMDSSTTQDYFTHRQRYIR